MNATPSTKQFSRADYHGEYSTTVHYAINGKNSVLGSLVIDKTTFVATLTGTPTDGLQKEPAKFIPLVAAAYALAALDIAEVQAHRAEAEALKVAQAEAAKKAEEAARKEAKLKALLGRQVFAGHAYGEFSQANGDKQDLHVYLDKGFYGGQSFTPRALDDFINKLSTIRDVLRG